jgi:hypothetical protein
MKKFNQLETEKADLKEMIKNMNETLNSLLSNVNGVYVLLPSFFKSVSEPLP